MTRLLIFLFVLNTLLPSIGLAAMLSPNTNETSIKSHRVMMIEHCSHMDSHNNCDDQISSDLCQVQCAASTGGASHISLFSFDIPFVASLNDFSLNTLPLYTRPILPELRPPLS